jgi:hypothetical protein
MILAVAPQMLREVARSAYQRIRFEEGGDCRDHLRALGRRFEVAEGDIRERLPGGLSPEYVYVAEREELKSNGLRALQRTSTRLREVRRGSQSEFLRS